MPKEKNNNLQPNLSDLQPSLFDLPETRVASDDFFKSKWKKEKWNINRHEKIGN